MKNPHEEITRPSQRGADGKLVQPTHPDQTPNPTETLDSPATQSPLTALEQWSEKFAQSSDEAAVFSGDLFVKIGRLRTDIEKKIKRLTQEKADDLDSSDIMALKESVGLLISEDYSVNNNTPALRDKILTELLRMNYEQLVASEHWVNEMGGYSTFTRTKLSGIDILVFPNKISLHLISSGAGFSETKLAVIKEVALSMDPVPQTLISLLT